MRKEPIVFLAFAAFLGYQASQMLGSTVSRSRSDVNRKDYVHQSLPDVSLATADRTRAIDFERDLFAPPSATTPLPPLGAELPPLEPLTALMAPTGWGPAPAFYGALLRIPVRPENAAEVPGLFDLGEADDIEDVGGETEEVLDIEELPDDPDARAARIAGFKKQYDWIFNGSFRFGRIENEDRYTLDPADNPSIVFLEVNPATGVPKFGATITYDPGEVEEFGLVDEPLTFIEVGLAEFDDPLRTQDFDEALAHAEQCLLLRNDTPRALEVAEELFRRAQAINTQDDPRPRLGLARALELGFKLEEAFAVYEDLVASGHGSNPVVHARLGELYATLRMDEAAEVEFRQGIQLGRTDWEAQLRYGEFLAKKGRHEEALVHLKEAVLREPKGATGKPWRVRARLAHAGALLAAGRADDAFDAFSTAVSADQANEVGLKGVAEAGKLSAARLAESPAAREYLGARGSGDVVDGSFEVLLAEGLFAMDQGRFEESAQALELAASADPFRAFEAMRAQCRLAEITSNPEDAASFAQDAFEANPQDPWTLYQLGRLAEASGDRSEARSAYRAALDLELDLVPALERMATLMQDAGEHEAAERYYERAVTIEPGAANLWSRRGWNAFSLGNFGAAEESLREARRLQPSLESARAGLAWWQYATGATEEAITLFSEIVDDRRAVGDDDPVVAYAVAQSERIRDHVDKEVFRDRFDRPNGSIANGWKLDQGFGPVVELVDGEVLLSGTNERGGRTRAFLSLPPDRFLAMSMEVTVGAASKGTRAGLFIGSEATRTGGVTETQAEIVVSRSMDGDLQVRVQKSPSDDEASHTTVPGPTWPLGTPIRVMIEKTGDDLETRFTLYVDGEPVAAGLEAERLMASRNSVNFGVFVEGAAGRVADVKIDNVRVVRRR